MQSTYKYRFDHSTIYWTLIYIIVFVLLGGLLYHLYEGGYLSAWFTSFIVALVALMSLSIPRKIVVSDETVEVRCLLDITEIRRDEIASVRRVDPKRMKWFLPIFGGCGFFGYYGHFIDLRRLDAWRPLRLGVAEFRPRSRTSTKTDSMSRAPMPTGWWPNSLRRRKPPRRRCRGGGVSGSQFAYPLFTL